MVAKKDNNAPKHPSIEGVPNLQVVEAAKVCKSNRRGYLSFIECKPHNIQVSKFHFKLASIVMTMHLTMILKC